MVVYLRGVSKKILAKEVLELGEVFPDPGMKVTVETSPSRLKGEPDYSFLILTLSDIFSPFRLFTELRNFHNLKAKVKSIFTYKCDPNLLTVELLDHIMLNESLRLYS